MSSRDYLGDETTREPPRVPLHAFASDDRRDGWVAAFICVLWHVALLFMAHGTAVEAPGETGTTTWVVFLERPTPTAQGTEPLRDARRRSLPTPHQPQRRHSMTLTAHRPGITEAVVVRKSEDATVEATGPATLADDRWIQPIGRPVAAVAFSRDPLDQRVTTSPVGNSSRFRMAKPRSPEDLVIGAAQLLGLRPAGYTTDPCPGIERDIAALSGLGQSRSQLEDALEQERRHCR